MRLDGKMGEISQKIPKIKHFRKTFHRANPLLNRQLNSFHHPLVVSPQSPAPQFSAHSMGSARVRLAGTLAAGDAFALAEWVELAVGIPCADPFEAALAGVEGVALLYWLVCRWLMAALAWAMVVGASGVEVADAGAQWPEK